MATRANVHAGKQMCRQTDGDVWCGVGVGSQEECSLMDFCDV